MQSYNANWAVHAVRSEQAAMPAYHMNRCKRPGSLGQAKGR